MLLKYLVCGDGAHKCVSGFYVKFKVVKSRTCTIHHCVTTMWSLFHLLRYTNL